MFLVPLVVTYALEFITANIGSRALSFSGPLLLVSVEFRLCVCPQL